MEARPGFPALCPWGLVGQVKPIVLRKQQLELGHSKVLGLPPQLAVDLQDLAFLPG